MLQRFLARGKKELVHSAEAPDLVAKCPFDSDFYLDRYPDVLQSGLDPHLHFLAHGWREGRSPHPAVDVEAFWSSTTDGHWRSPEGVLGELVASLSESRAGCSGYVGHPTCVDPTSVMLSEIALGDADLVTFDCWDTLLRRSVHPDYVKLMGIRAALSAPALSHFTDGSGNPADGTDWALLRLRLQAEGDLALRPACEQCRNSASVHEYGHGEAIGAWLGEAGVDPEHLDEVITLVRDRELSFEREVVRVHRAGGPLLREAQRAGLAIAIVTDTYYDREFIKSLLSGVGLEVSPEDIYASCEWDESKRHGTLLDIVRTERGVAPARHLHIGDSPEADRDSQARAGGLSHLLAPPTHVFPLTPAVAAADALTRHTSEGATLATGRVDRIAEAWSHARGRKVKDLAIESESVLFWDGYRLGPALAALLAESIQVVKRSPVLTKRVFFLSREGQVLADIAVRAQQAKLFPPDLSIEHLAVSRLSTFLPTLRSDPSDLMRIWNQYSVQSPSQLWATLRLTHGREARETFERMGHAWKTPVTYPWQVPSFMEAVQRLWPLIQSDAVEARDGLRAYLLSKRFVSEEQPLCIDVGWRGTIQDNLAISARRRTRGVYLGLFQILNEQHDVEKIGVAFDENRHELPEGSTLRRITPVERLLTAHTASVLSYTRIGQPLFGELHPLDPAVAHALEVFQHGAAEGVIDCLAEIDATTPSRDERAELAAQCMAEFLSTPTSSVAALYFSLIHDESFGVGRDATPDERAASWPEGRDVLQLQSLL